MSQAAPAPVHSFRSTRGTQREYETVLIVRPNMNKPAILELVGRFQKIFDKEGARLQRIDNWGLRTLAYPIKQNKKGIYLYIRFLGGSDTVTELERNLRIYEEVVRFLTVLVDEDVDPEARPTEVTEELLDAASDSPEDPVEIARAKAEAEAKAAAEAAAAEAAANEAAAAAAAEAADANTEDDKPAEDGE